MEPSADNPVKGEVAKSPVEHSDSEDESQIPRRLTDEEDLVPVQQLDDPNLTHGLSSLFVE
jgi:hypothetical protein